MLETLRIVYFICNLYQRSCWCLFCKPKDNTIGNFERLTKQFGNLPLIIIKIYFDILINLVLNQVCNKFISSQAKLNCPCCNTRRKDAILTKCFHVFCMECLKTRYDTRQRKCPKCNATFGNNDFRKIYM